MNQLLEKLGSYQILTNLLPGAFLGLSLNFFFDINLPSENLGEDILIYYFIGLVVNRTGALIIEPFLKKIRFIRFEPYKKFVQALRNDSKIDVLSENNNLFRALLTCIILLPLIKLGQWLSASYAWFSSSWKWLVIILIFLLFLFSYKRQCSYICKRINMVVGEKKENDIPL